MLNDIGYFVGSLGFPIVMCILMYKGMRTSIDNNTDAINELRIANAKLCEKLDRKG